MSGKKPVRSHLQFPEYQPGHTALRGLGGKALQNVHVRKPSQSVHLTNALRKAGHRDVVPATNKMKADLSYVSHTSKRSKQDPTIVLHPTSRPSMQYFVAQYIEALSENMGTADASLVVPQSVRSWVLSKGYAWEDLELWARILMAKSSDDAVSMLLGRHAKGPTPIWIVLYLLRRERLTLGAFRHLYRFALSQVGLSGTPKSRNKSQAALEIDEKTVFLLFVRLLRHARNLLPSAIVPLTKLITTKINPRNLGTRQCEVAPDQIKEETMIEKRIKLAHIYNKVLNLLALPGTPNPYSSAMYQERAQFEILRRISEYEPPIPITQDGYRALVKIQLAHVKTDKERLWGSLKSKRWPPWKEDRTAMDEDIVHDEAISRAGQLLRSMMETGYPRADSDQAATILTGWDLDESPTIQTRIIHYPNDPPGKVPPSSQMVLHPAIWAARVRSTRTLEEAWACFLAYDSSGSPQKQEVYLAMFEQVVADRRRERRQNRRSYFGDLEVPAYGLGWKDPVPGDSPDVWPVPKSPRDRIDPTFKLPNTKDLFDRMVSKGLTPSGRCLEFLVRTAANYTEALDIMTQVLGSNQAVRSLLKSNITPDEAEAIPQTMFRAYILLLARLWYQPIPFLPHRRRLDQRPLLLHRALDLLSLRKSNDRHCWNSVLIALSHYGLQNLDNTTTDIMRDAIETMSKLEVDLDQDGFGIICKAFSMRTTAREKNIRARHNDLRNYTDMRDLLASVRGLQAAWDKHLAHCSADSHYLRALFNHLVGAEPHKTNEALSDLQVPIPHVMHRYVRTLGIMYDFEGLLSVAEFLKENAVMLVFNTNYATNGRVRLRAAIVALRAHLEFRPWLRYGRSSGPTAAEIEDTGSSDPKSYRWDLHTVTSGRFFDSGIDAAEDVILSVPRHSEEQVELARRKLDDAAARDLGGWPSDDEISTYMLGSQQTREAAERAEMERAEMERKHRREGYAEGECYPNLE